MFKITHFFSFGLFILLFLAEGMTIGATKSCRKHTPEKVAQDQTQPMTPQSQANPSFDVTSERNLFIKSTSTLEEIPTPFTIDDFLVKTFGDRSNPALILIHGVGSDHSTFDRAALHLSERYFVIAYDQRGHGFSSDRGLDYSLEALSRDLIVILDSLQIDRAHILGHSFGGRTAVRFSEMYPERVLSLIVEDMELIPRLKGKDLKESYEKWARKVKDLPRSYDSIEELRASVGKLFPESKATLYIKDAKQNQEKWILTNVPYVNTLYTYYANSADLTSALSHSNFPILFLKSHPYGAISQTGLKQIQKDLPKAKIVEIQNANHNIHKSQTERFVEAVLTFLESIQ